MAKLQERHAWIEKYYSDGGIKNFDVPFVHSQDIQEEMSKIKQALNNEIHTNSLHTEDNIKTLSKYENLVLFNFLKIYLIYIL